MARLGGKAGVNPDDLLRSEQLKEILAKVDIPTFETGNLSPKEA